MKAVLFDLDDTLMLYTMNLEQNPIGQIRLDFALVYALNKEETIMPTEAQLQDLLDKQEISEVVGPRLSRALDWLDEAMLKTCFHEDGTVDFGFFKGNAHDWCTMVIPIESSFEHRYHYYINIRVVVSGDKAEAEANGIAGRRTTTDDGTRVQSIYGNRYIHKLEKRDGVWKISNLIHQLDFVQELAASGMPGGDLSSLQLVSGLGPDHPLYRPMGPD